MMDSLIGDEPSGSKYALICSNCATHNGLVMAHEYSTTRFICFRCGTLNDKNTPMTPVVGTRQSVGGLGDAGGGVDLVNRRASISNPEVLGAKEPQVERNKRHTVQFGLGVKEVLIEDDVGRVSTMSTGSFVDVEEEEAIRRRDSDGYKGDESNMTSQEDLPVEEEKSN
jgi:ribosomal protein S27AE